MRISFDGDKKKYQKCLTKSSSCSLNVSFCKSGFLFSLSSKCGDNATKFRSVDIVEIRVY